MQLTRRVAVFGLLAAWVPPAVVPLPRPRPKQAPQPKPQAKPLPKYEWYWRQRFTLIDGSGQTYPWPTMVSTKEFALIENENEEL